MHWFTKISLANRSLVALATVAVIIIGGFAIFSLKQELFPPVELPTVTVVTPYPGASPSSVEGEVTSPIEQSIQGVDNLEEVTSYSNEGLSIILAEFDYGTDAGDAQQELSEKINGAQGDLPQDVTPQVEAFDVSSLPVVQLAVTSEESEAVLAERLQDEVVPELESIEGVGGASVSGVRSQVVNVALDPQGLQEAGISPEQVAGALQANNLTLPGGSYSEGGQTFPVQVGNELRSIEDIENLVVGVSGQSAAGASAAPAGVSGAELAAVPGGASAGELPAGTLPAAPREGEAAQPEPVALRDVATVEEALAPSSSVTRTNGEPSLGIAITKAPEGNTVAISEEVQDRIPELEETLGEGTRIRVILDQAPFIERSIEGLTTEGLLGAGFAVLVILLFLLSIRSTLVTAVSIPLSVVIALIALWTGDLSLNILTLGGLTIAVGRVVDDSIVVLENIHRHLGYGEEKRAAIVTATREVAGAITSSTMTTVAVFLPIAFTGDIVGELFGSFSIAVTVALLASLVVALTIVPVLAYWFMKPSARVPREAVERRERNSRLQRAYIPIIRWAIDHRAITLTGAAVIFAGTIALTPLLETNFFERPEENTFSLRQELPPGSSLEVTDGAAQEVEDALAGIPEVESYQVTAGSDENFIGAGFSSGPNTATYTVTTDPEADQKEVEQTLRERLGDLEGAGEITVQPGQSGVLASSLEVLVQSSDEEELRRVSDGVAEIVEDVEGTADVSSNLSESALQVSVRVNPNRALESGLTAAQVAQAVRQVYEGETATTVTLDGEERDVLLRLGSPANSVEELQQLPIPAATGNVALGDIAEVEEVSGPTQVTSVDGERMATISATATDENVGAISAEIQERTDELDLPEGVTVSLGGVTAEQEEAFRDLGLALVVAILLVYLIMVATFRSVLQPLLLLVSIPFAATGAILLLLLTDTTLGTPALIGALMLVGIVVTNAIVLLDLIRQYRERGMDARTAVIEGGRHRLRPILMTAAATILALTPMAVGLTGEGAFLSQPLAIVVIGGLASSTILTLVLVPCLYMLFEGTDRGTRERPAAPSAPARGVAHRELLNDIVLRYIEGQAERPGTSPNLTAALAGLVPESEGSPEERARIAARRLADNLNGGALPRSETGGNGKGGRDQ